MKARILITLVAAILFSAMWLFLQRDAGPKEIRIESQPSGALLSVNGKEVGKTPYVWRRPALGKYWLQFRKDGFEALDRFFEVSVRSLPEAGFKLQNQNGLVLFETTPSGAEVSVNGVYKGKTPFLATDLPYGSHTASFSLQGYDPQEMELVIQDRIPKLCQMSMRLLFATVRIESIPKGATVVLDGIQKGQTPCSVDVVLIGNHVLKLTKSGYKPYEEQLKLTQTGIIPLKIQLEKQSAALGSGQHDVGD